MEEFDEEMIEEIEEKPIDLKKYFTEEILKEILGYALTQFYKNDIDLMDYETEKAEASERCMVFHIGWYILEKIKNYNILSMVNVDCEYNRNMGAPKKIKRIYNKSSNGQGSKRVIPDLLIHQRRSNDNNLFVAEFKKELNHDDFDEFKLKCFTSKEDVYNYKFGAFIGLYRDKKATIRLYKNGKLSTKWHYKMIKDSTGNIAWKITEE